MRKLEAVNVSGGIRYWGILGNDVDGDCTVAAYYHIVMAKNVVRLSPLTRFAYRIGFKVPGTKFALAKYTEYLATLNEKPSPETGVALDGWLNWMMGQGQVIDWVQLNPTLPDYEGRIREAMVQCGGVMLVGQLSKESYYNWGPGTTWKYSPTVPAEQPDPTLGHAIAMLAYKGDNDYAVTWATWQAMTSAYREACMTSAFVFLHKDDQKLPDFSQRLTYLQSLKAA